MPLPGLRTLPRKGAEEARVCRGRSSGRGPAQGCCLALALLELRSQACQALRGVLPGSRLWG